MGAGASGPVVVLRRVEDADVEAFFGFEADPEAAAMAAFPSRDRERVEAHWARLRADDSLYVRTIEADGQVAGNILSWPDEGGQWLGYWVGRGWWGRGVATRALTLLLDELPVRPLHAHVVAHNAGSIRVLERCGFRREPALEHGPGEDGVVELAYVLGA